MYIVYYIQGKGEMFMANVNLYTIIGAIKEQADDSITIITLDNTEYTFTISEATTNMLPDSLMRYAVAKITYSDVSTEAVIASVIELVPDTILGTVCNITDTVITIRTHLDSNERYSFAITEDTEYSFAKPVKDGAIKIVFTGNPIGGDAKAVHCQCIPVGASSNNQVGGVPTHISDTEFPALKNEGEYVYPNDWNALLKAVKVLNANAQLLAELVTKHNTLDATILDIAQGAIMENSIASAHLEDNCIISTKLSANAVLNKHYSPASISSDKVVDTFLGTLFNAQFTEVSPKSTYGTASGTIIPKSETDYTRQVAIEIPLSKLCNIVVAFINGSVYGFRTKHPTKVLYLGKQKDTSGESTPYCTLENTTASADGVITQALQAYNTWVGWYLAFPEMTANNGKSGLIGCYLKTDNQTQKLVFVFEQRLYKDEYHNTSFTAQVFGC